MGRPINKQKLGFGSGRIAVSRHFFTGGAEATTSAHIVRQVASNKFVVRLDSNNDGGGPFSPRTHASDEVMTLVNKANGTMSAGEFRIDAVGSDSTTYQVTRLHNRTVQLEDNDKAIYNIGFDASAKENSAVPNAVLSVALPSQ